MTVRGVQRFRSVPNGDEIQRASDAALAEWEATHRRKVRGRVCIHWLLGTRCDDARLDCLPPGFDHVSGWWRRSDGALVLVSQPYADQAPTEAEDIAFGASLGLRVIPVAPDRSWHYPGRTVMRVFTCLASGPAKAAAVRANGRDRLVCGCCQRPWTRKATRGQLPTFCPACKHPPARDRSRCKHTGIAGREPRLP